MKLTYNIYRIVKFVDSETNRLDKKYPNNLRDKGRRIVPKKGDTLKYFNRDHPKMKYETISGYFDYATNRKYLKLRAVGNKKIVTIDSNGMDIIEGWPLFPWWGLLREIWNKDSKLVIAIWSAVGGFILALLTALI